MDEQLNNYLTNLLPAKQDWICDLERQAKEENVPIMDSLSIHFILQLLRLNRPNRILEIGTAIGYSALRMLDANPIATVVTIEKDDHRYKHAVENINRLNKQDRIRIIHGDALEEIIHLGDQHEYFDCIFIDAAKGQYKRFFELSDPLLKDNGFIISDNVLFRGYVSDENFYHKRYKKMVNKIRAFNEWLIQHPDYMTSIVPIGDGVAISYKDRRKGASV